MPIDRHVDVLVVGGGPAGSTAATQLAKQGYDVLLVDKQHHPRETVGESLLPSAWKYFDLLGVTDAVVAHGFIRKAGGIVAWGDQLSQIAFRDFEYTRPGLHVERDALDALLLRHAAASGARVEEGVRADAITTSEGHNEATLIRQGETGGERVRARLLIDASGQASVMARQLGTRQVNPEYRFIALWGYFADSLYMASGGTVRPFADVRTHPPMTFVSRLGEWGWSWHIPLKEMTSVGLVIPIDDYKRDSGRFATLEAYFLSVCHQAAHLGQLLAGATLVNGGIRVMRDFSYVSDVVAGPGFMITGDAAGFVDPIFSIGVVMALYSGQLTAWTADRLLRQPDRAEAIRAMFAHQMRGRYRLAHTMALPGVESASSEAPGAYFDFFSDAEKQLMWSAASMTTRSANLSRISEGQEPPAKPRRLDLAGIDFNQLALAGN